MPDPDAPAAAGDAADAGARFLSGVDIGGDEDYFWVRLSGKT